MKLILTSKEIKYIIVDNNTGRITESGEEQGKNDTFEETFVDLSSIEIGKPPKISYNKTEYTNRKKPISPVWVDLLYNVTEIITDKR